MDSLYTEEWKKDKKRFIEAIAIKQPNLSLREIFEIARSRFTHEVYVTPGFIIEFVKEMILQSGSNRVYVPMASGTEIEELGPLVKEIDCFVLDKEIGEIIKAKTGVDCLSEPAKNLEYDLIFSDLPFGRIKENGIQQLIVNKCIDQLSSNGYGLFTFPGTIMRDRNARKWFLELRNKGLFLSGTIDLPDRLYYPSTLIESKLLIFSKEVYPQFFIAKLKKDDDIPKMVETFFTGERRYNNESLGKWIEYDTYPDYLTYEKEKRRINISKKIEKAYNGNMLTISTISSSIKNLYKGDYIDTDIENSVFVPKIGNGPVYTAKSGIIMKNYYQVIVNPNIVLPSFVKFFLNSENGKTTRILAGVGNASFLSLESLKSIQIPVPALNIQLDILNVLNELDIIEDETQKLKTHLSEKPASYKNILKELLEINYRGDKFEKWYESLPYPLSTILKQYSICDTDQKRQEMLLFFFEAYSIFIAAIMTSVYQQPQFQTTVIKDVVVDFFEKASFGSWIKMDRALAKVFREKMGNPETIDIVLNSFHTDDSSIINLICQKEVLSILERTCEYRNSWKGHSGITSIELYADHVRILKEELNGLQKCIKDLFDKIHLIRPIKLKHINGTFINTVEQLSGSNPIFRKEELIGDSLDESKLYLHVLDKNETIEMPPFFLLKSYPREVNNACYFYNRIEGTKSKYVSYHFDGQPEEYEDGEIVFDIIRSVLERNNG
jgi:hypothetical protein